MKLAVGWGVSSSRLAQLLARGCPSPGPLRRACSGCSAVSVASSPRRASAAVPLSRPPRQPCRNDGLVVALGFELAQDGLLAFGPWPARAVTQGIGLLALTFAVVVWKLIGNGADWFVLVFPARFSSSDSS
jgi:hypothetical protein